MNLFVQNQKQLGHFNPPVDGDTIGPLLLWYTVFSDLIKTLLEEKLFQEIIDYIIIVIQCRTHLIANGICLTLTTVAGYINYKTINSDYRYLISIPYCIFLQVF